MNKQRILCVGPQFRGSNAGGLFRALGRVGCLIDVIDEFYYLSLQQDQNFAAKVSSKLSRNLQIQSFNRGIESRLRLFEPNIILVYKGAFVNPKLLQEIRNKSYKLVNFFPDVSFFSHGSYIPKAMPLYHQVFTTKTFGVNDLREKLGVRNAVFIPHGFDPEIHRPIEAFEPLKKHYKSDLSFIGTWSPKKERILTILAKALPDAQFKIWGNQWEKAREPILHSRIQYSGISGDMYALAIQASTINLAILSERVRGASSGDKITSRTFHIPASGGFMIHEHNDESIQYYQEGKEAVFFQTEEELIEQVKYYLMHPDAREEIRLAGLDRAWKDHSLDQRAIQVLTHLRSL